MAHAFSRQMRGEFFQNDDGRAFWHVRSIRRQACAWCAGGSNARTPRLAIYHPRMPFLLIPLLVLGAIALWALLLPFALIQRYRYGKARRRIQGWVVRANAWLLLFSVGCFLLSAMLALLWERSAGSSFDWLGAEHSILYAAVGLGSGALLGWLGLAITRFESNGAQLLHTPNRWLVLGLTLAVAARIALLIGQFWMRWRGVDAAWLDSAWLDHRSVFAAGGLLLGYYCAYVWGLHARFQRWRRQRPN